MDCDGDALAVAEYEDDGVADDDSVLLPVDDGLRLSVIEPEGVDEWLAEELREPLGDCAVL